MTAPLAFLTDTLVPALAWTTQVLGPVPPNSGEARLLLLAIAGQEGDWQFRIQQGNGAAHSFWQMERLGGVNGVMMNAATEAFAHKVCDAAGVAWDRSAVWGLMATATGDNLACAFARLLLWTDPEPLPAPGDEQASFDYYVRNWRPGAVSEGGDRAVQARDRFHTVYQQALAADEAWRTAQFAQSGVATEQPT